jgi:UDP-N-acetylglucosamine acyltransferase
MWRGFGTPSPEPLGTMLEKTSSERIRVPIHPTAVVDPRAEIAPSAKIGPYVVIEGPVQIGEETVVDPFAAISGFTQIGANCTIHSGAKIGGLPQDMAYRGGESYCRIGDRTIVREGCTIHRGTVAGSATVVYCARRKPTALMATQRPVRPTVVGSDCLLMVNSHVGHNCELADHVILVNGALLGGYVSVGTRAIVSGNAAVHQFVRIGRLAMIGGMAKVVQDIPPFLTVGRTGRCVAINAVGLRRAQYTPGERGEVRSAFGVLYRSGLPLEGVIGKLRDEVSTEAGRQFLSFLTAPSKRGIAGSHDKNDVV